MELIEWILAGAAVVAVTAVGCLYFFRRIKWAQVEYEAARDSVRNITFGFTRQVNRLQQDIAHAENNAETAKIAAAEALKASGEAKEATLQGLEHVKALNDKVNGAESAVEDLRKEVQKIQQQPRQRIVVPAEAIPAAIPVQQSNILGQLTETELAILKRIADLGTGSTPDIKDEFKMSREHTSRVLNKLFESGYMDRDTSRMPYKYSVRKEIRDLILSQPTEQPGL